MNDIIPPYNVANTPKKEPLCVHISFLFSCFDYINIFLFHLFF